MKAYRFNAWVLWVAVGLLALLPIMASAETLHTLQVTLRDVNGAGIVGATITVRDETGTHALAHTTTDAQGAATLPNLPAAVVRVGVSGSLGDATPLNQRGQDAHGIWLLLDAPLVHLDLRSELNGDILPDPTTMISRDVPIPARPAATEDAATNQANLAPTSAMMMPTNSVGGIPTALPFAALPNDLPPDAPPIRPAQIGRALVIAGVVIGILFFALWLVWRRRVCL